MAAQLGAMGSAGGGTAQMLNATLKLRQEMVDQQATDTTKKQLYDMSLQESNQRDMMILGLADVQFMDGINMQEVQPRNIQVPGTGEIMANAALSFMSAYSQLNEAGAMKQDWQQVTGMFSSRTK